MAREYGSVQEAMRVAPERVQVLNLSLPRKPRLDLDLTRFPNLRKLTLSAPRLERLPTGLFESAGLTELNLYGIPLGRLPDGIGRLARLQSVTLNSCGLTRLPDAIGGLRDLRYLSLDFNRLTTLPDVFHRLPRLVTLSCFNNRLNALPASIARASSLEWVQFSANRLPKTATLERLSSRVEVFMCDHPELSVYPGDRKRRASRARASSGTATVTRLLQRLRDSNERDGTPQRVGKPGRSPTRIPTLAARVFKPVSPQLEERFQFAGQWVAAWVGQTFLLPDQMSPPLPAGLRKQVALRRENHTDSVVSRTPLERLTLFGVDRLDQSETYLVWSEGSVEPEVVTFAGWSESRYRDLRAFVKAISGHGD